MYVIIYYTQLRRFSNVEILWGQKLGFLRFRTTPRLNPKSPGLLPWRNYDVILSRGTVQHLQQSYSKI